MTEAEISVYIERKLKVSLDECWLKCVAQKALEVEGITAPVEMGLVITDADTVRQLNRTYRGEDEATDVLAFYTLSQTGQEHEPPFVTPPDGIRHLGEVVISYPQAVQQAQEQRHGIEKELTLLTVHGVLHLLGHDHEQLEQRRRMRAKEEEILKELEAAKSKK